MQFVESKYTHWYYKIVVSAQNRNLSAGTYRERHHIIPRSLGGNNCRDNVVNLTAREHFVCHWLLTKMTVGDAQKKMAYACKRMMHSSGPGQERYRITGRIYEQLKNNLNLILKNREFTDEWRAKLKVSARARADNEDEQAKSIRRATMIRVNNNRKGEKRPWLSGANNHFYGVRMTGAANPFFGKKHTEESLAKMRGPQPKYVCPHCNKTVGGRSNFERWHNENCKEYGESKFLG